MRRSKLSRWLIAGVGVFALACLPGSNRGAWAADRAESKERTKEAASSGIDWDKAKAIHQKSEQGEKLTDEEQAYLQKAKDAMARGDGPGQRGPANVKPEDIERAKALKQKMDNGEKLSDDEKAFLEKIRAAMTGERDGGERKKPDTEKPAGKSDIDWEKAKALHQRASNGEKLTEEEQAYYEKAKAALQRGEGPGKRGGEGGERPKEGERPKGRQQPAAPPAARESTGMIPLPQLGEEKYKGFEGGLYGGGKNDPPAAHAKAGIDAAARIKPLDADGKPSATGKIVLLSIGMSNTTQEFSRFKQIADADSEKSPNLVVVDGAQGGRAADDWVDASMPTYQAAEQRMSAQKVTPKQVQIIWIKQALKMPSRLGEFPEHAKALQSDIEKILRAAKSRYPNVQIAYLSNRIYAGYASSGLNPEPFAYESAFADRWVIEKQIAGDASLNHDPAKGEVKSPIVLWGPYLWSDGTKGRKADELVYTREDLGPDGTHPSDKGRQKVAEQLLKFFKTDATAKTWFAKQ
jgi:hypothetical protein